jgi:hypothetical protein
LADQPSGYRTGDGGFGASKAQQRAFFSVGKLGGSLSFSIRPKEQWDSADPYREFEFLGREVPSFGFAFDSPK